MTDNDALQIAELAAGIVLPDDAPQAVRARFNALQHLAGRVRELTRDGAVAELEHKLEDARAEVKRLVGADSEARRLRMDLFDIEKKAEMEGLPDFQAMALKARLGEVAAAAMTTRSA